MNLQKGGFDHFNISVDFLEYREVQNAIKDFGTEILSDYIITCCCLIKYKGSEATNKVQLIDNLYQHFDSPSDKLNRLYKAKLIQVRKNGQVYSRFLQNVMLKGVKKHGSNAKQKEFHPLNEWLKKNCPLVCRMKIQMSYKDCEDLIKTHGEPMVKEKLLEMNNKPTINRKYTSVKQTCHNWCKMEKNRLQNNTPKSNSPFKQSSKF